MKILKRCGYSWILALIIILFTFSSTLAADKKPLILGIFPYVSSGKFIAHNKDFKNHLELSLNRKVIIVSAPNLKIFAQRSAKNDFDFVFTAPHHGYYLEKNLKYQRIAMTKNKIQGYYLVKKDSSINSLDDLRDKKLSLAPAITILHQMAAEQLRTRGLFNKDTITFINSTSHNNSMFLLLNNKSDAALTGIKLWLKLHDDHKAKLRVLAKTPPVPGFLLMANQYLSEDIVAQLQKSTLDFNTTPAGQKYLFQGFQLIDDDTTKELDAYTSVFANIKE